MSTDDSSSGDSSASSDEDTDTNVRDRIQQKRRKQQIVRDNSDDEDNSIKRKSATNKTKQRHQRRAKRHSDEDSESGSDSDSMGVMKKRQPAARGAITRSQKAKNDRKNAAMALRSKNKRKKKGSSGNGSTSDLAFEIDKEDLKSSTILTIEERNDFFKMQSSGLGLSDAAPLLSVNDFGLSVESVVQDAQDNTSNRSSSNTARKAWVYVENMATGRFKKVHMGRLGYSRLVDHDSEESINESSLTGPDIMENSTHSITALVAGVFQFAQGLLAGLALLHLFLVSSITAFGTFTAVYQPLSNESRRLYFILSSLGLTSAIETFLRETENKELWNTLSPMQKIRILMCCLLYLMACGFSLAMMPTDAYISTDPTVVNALRLRIWNSFEYIR
jgi:hypothetical protein